MKKILMTIMIAIMFMQLTVSSTSAKTIVDYSANEAPRIEYLNDSIHFNTINVNMPSMIRIYEGESYQIKINAFDKEIQNTIKYNIENEILKIWLDNMTSDDISDISSESIRISIEIPNEVSIRTNSNLQLVNKQIHKNVTSYERN